MKVKHKHVLCSLLFLCSSLFIINSCRKIDAVSKKQPTATSNISSTAFFNAHTPDDPAVLAVRQFVKSENEKYLFAEKLVKAIGIPHWDKALVFGKNASTLPENRDNSPADSTIVYVPFARESQQYVNASLVVKMKGNDTTCKILYNWQYRSFGFGEKQNNAWNAQDFFHLFMLLEKQVFGHTKFLVTDNRLFPGNRAEALDSFLVDIKSNLQQTSSSEIAARLDIVRICTEGVIEVPCKAFRTESTTSSEYKCYAPHTYCTNFWIDMGGASGGPVAPVTGVGDNPPYNGGVPGSWTPPPPCPATIGEVARAEPGQEPPCDDAGWIPLEYEIINNVKDPCIKKSIDDAINQGCQNKITGFINTAFGKSEKFHLQFNDNILTGSLSGIDAYTQTGPMPDLIQTMTNITFNNSQLTKASKQYIAATILHEAVHAWIDYTFQNPIDNKNQHSLMAGTNRFNLMRNALIEMYPTMSFQDATDLTWGGLYKTIEFLSLSPAEQDRISKTNLDYKNGVKGTPC